MKSKFNIDVRVKNEVTAIRPEENKVTVKNCLQGETYEESYDHLIIATAHPAEARYSGELTENISLPCGISPTQIGSKPLCRKTIPEAQL